MGYELFGIVTEANGRAIPVAFVFTTSDESAAEHAKEEMLKDVIGYISARCPNIKFTLTDKDITEINAFRKKIPTAKHQLCYWHGIRYIEDRLAENKPPASYDPRKAHRVFDFIDPTWAPGVTAGSIEDGVHPDDIDFEPPPEPLKIYIHLKPRQNYSSVSQAPAVPKKPEPSVEVSGIS